MKTALEEQLSSALAQRAASVPLTATERVRSVDYHPRHRRLAVPVAVGTGAAASVATVGTVLAVVLGGATPAYAGWTPAPTAPSTASPASPASAASPSPQSSQSCQTALPSDQPGGGKIGSGSWQPVLSDERGPFTVVLFQNAGAYAACFTSASFTEITQVAADSSSATNAQTANGTVHTSGPGGPGGGMSSVSVGGTSSGDISNFVQTHLSTTADGPYTLVEGRVASGVTSVTLVLDNGQDVVATVADGWLVAWWPGDNAATSAQVTNASGTSTEALQSSTKTLPSGAPPAGFDPGACAAAAGAANASKTPSGAPTNVPVHCLGSGNSGDSGSSVNSTNSGSSGAAVKSSAG
jgi:hypothetical protein